MYIDPTKAAFNSVSINGTDVLGYTNTIRIFESICKPYLTGQLVLIDADNLIENMDLVGGEDVVVAFSAFPNDKVYQQTLHIFSIKGQPSPDNLNTIIYTIDLIGPVYYQDKANIVQSSHKQQTATSAAQQIFSQYLNKDTLQVLVPSIGMIGQKDAFQVINKKPLTAISDIMRTMLFGQYKSGNPLMFRDKDNVKLAPLEYLMTTLSQQEYYVQKETWGADFRDKDLYHAIIYAALLHDRMMAGGRGSAPDAAQSTNQAKSTFDWHKTANKISPPVMFPGKLGSIVQQFVSGAASTTGSTPNYPNWVTAMWPEETSPQQKNVPERIYSAQVRSAPQLQWKVPLQTGLNSTVGKGARVDLAPPRNTGQQNPYSYSLSGLYLVTDLVHNLVYGKNSEIIGTTSLQGVKQQQQ